MSTSSNSSGGIGICGILGIVFIILKLTNVIDWSWIWVTCPFWIGPAILIFLLLVAGIITGTVFLIEEKEGDGYEFLKCLCKYHLEFQLKKNTICTRLSLVSYDIGECVKFKRADVGESKSLFIRYEEAFKEIVGTEMLNDNETLTKGQCYLIRIINDVFLAIHRGEELNASRWEWEKKDHEIIVLIENFAFLFPVYDQTVIMSKFRKFFPEVKWVVTTNSPFVIKGASPDARIYRLFKDDWYYDNHLEEEEGEHNNNGFIVREKMNGWMFNIIVTHFNVFDLESAKMNDENDDYSTSGSFALMRVIKLIEKRLRERKKEGTKFLSDEEIDDMLNGTLDKAYNN